MIAKYAGMAFTILSSSNRISFTVPNIRNPTKISAGAVANDGIAMKIGAKNIEIKNNTPVVNAVKPVRPPAETPDADSTKVEK